MTDRCHNSTPSPPLLNYYNSPSGEFNSLSRTIFSPVLSRVNMTPSLAFMDTSTSSSGWRWETVNSLSPRNEPGSQNSRRILPRLPSRKLTERLSTRRTLWRSGKRSSWQFANGYWDFQAAMLRCLQLCRKCRRSRIISKPQSTRF